MLAKCNMSSQPLIRIIVFVAAIILHQPTNHRLGLRPQRTPLLFIHALRRILRPTLPGPFQNSILLQNLLVEQLLQHYGKLLRFLHAQFLKRGNEMTFHHRLPLRNFRYGGCVPRDLLLLHAIQVEGGADVNVYTILGFETGGHLFVDHLFRDGGGGGVGVGQEVGFERLDGEFERVFVVEIFGVGVVFVGGVGVGIDVLFGFGLFLVFLVLFLKMRWSV